MKLHAYVAMDGRLEALVAAPEGKLGAGLVAGPLHQVCEIRNHGFAGEVIELEPLEEMLRTHVVKVTPAQGELIKSRDEGS